MCISLPCRSLQLRTVNWVLVGCRGTLNKAQQKPAISQPINRASKSIVQKQATKSQNTHKHQHTPAHTRTHAHTHTHQHHQLHTMCTESCRFSVLRLRNTATITSTSTSSAPTTPRPICHPAAALQAQGRNHHLVSTKQNKQHMKKRARKESQLDSQQGPHVDDDELGGTVETGAVVVGTVENGSNGVAAPVGTNRWACAVACSAPSSAA